MNVIDSIEKPAVQKAREHLYTILSKQAQDCIFCKDRDFIYTYVNSAMLRLLNCESDDIVGKFPADVFDGPTAKVIRALDEQVLEGKTVDRVDTIQINGVAYVVHTIQVPISDDDKGVIGIYGIVRDVTELSEVGSILRWQRDLSTAFSKVVGLRNVLQCVLEHVLKFESVTAGGIYLRSKDTGDLDLVAHQGLSDGFIEKSSHYDANSVQANIVLKGKSKYTHYSKYESSFDETRKKEKLRAVGIIPLKHENVVIGALNISSHIVDHFSEHLQSAIEVISGMVGGAIVRAQTHDALKKSEKERGEIEEIVSEISSRFIGFYGNMIDQGINDCLQWLSQSTNAVRISVFTFSEELAVVWNPYEWCKDPRDSQQGKLQGVPSTVLGYYLSGLKDFQNIVVRKLEDLPADGAEAERKSSEEHGFRPVLFVPMVKSNRLHGAIGFYGDRGETARWSKSLISQLRYTANLFLNILERKEAEDLILTQRHLAMALGAAGELDEILSLCIDTALQLTGMDSGGIYLVDDATGDLNLETSKGLGVQFSSEARYYKADSDHANVIMLGNPIYLSGEEMEPLLSEVQRREQLKCLAVVPIKHMQKVVACINISSHKLESMQPHLRNPLEILVAQMGSVISRAKADEALKRSGERYRNFIEHSNEGIYRIDIVPPVDISLGDIEIIEYINTYAIVAEVNDALARMYGLKPEDMIGRRATDFAPNYGKRAVLVLHAKNNQVRNIETLDVDKNNNFLYLDENYYGEIKKGKLVRIWGVQRDITDRKKIEEQLRQAEKMQAVGQLAGGIAHDFNNQLAGIVGYADILSQKLPESSSLASYAEKIILATQRASDLTAQLLAFSRKGKYLTDKVDIHEIIAEVVGILLRTIDKRIVIKQHLDAQQPTVLGDPSQIQNAILNIALNARDAMPGGGELIFSTEIVQLDEDYCAVQSSELSAGAFVQICVTDSGSGIEKEIQKRMFEPFFTTKEVGKGTGMGLAAVYGTIKNHSGSINVYSEVGRGTSIKIYLPHDNSEPEPVASVPDKVSSLKGAANILIVDDEESILEVASTQLTHLGYTVKQCKNGQEAVDYYRANWRNIDLVIIDMVMPSMSGKDAYIKMKEIHPDVVVLLSSGYSINEEAQIMLDEGVNGFIQKPYRLTALSQKIAEVLKK